MKHSIFSRGLAAVLAFILMAAGCISAASAGTSVEGEDSETAAFTGADTEPGQIGEVKINYGTGGDRKLVRDRPDPQSNMVCALDPGTVYPCFGKTTGSNRRTWYYIYIQMYDFWGWVSENVVTFSPSAAGGDPEAAMQDESGGEYPERSPIGTGRTGEVEIAYGNKGDRKILRDKPDSDSNLICALVPGMRYPCYGETTGEKWRTWYYIYIPEYDFWGWISEGVSVFTPDEASSAPESLPVRDAADFSPDAYPEESPMHTARDGEVEIIMGENKTVRERPDPNSGKVAMVEPGRRFPCYGSQRGTTGKIWYYIWIPELQTWGWISSILATWYR